MQPTHHLWKMVWAADNVQQKAAVITAYMLPKMLPNPFLPILPFNVAIIDLTVFHPLLTPGSYLLQCPQGVHHRLDFLLVIETQEFVHHRFHEATFSVFEKEVEERESCYNFVLLI